jgi:hypothetical protein
LAFRLHAALEKVRQEGVVDMDAASAGVPFALDIRGENVYEQLEQILQAGGEGAAVAGHDHMDEIRVVEFEYFMVGGIFGDLAGIVREYAGLLFPEAEKIVIPEQLHGRLGMAAEPDKICADGTVAVDVAGVGQADEGRVGYADKVFQHRLGNVHKLLHAASADDYLGHIVDPLEKGKKARLQPGEKLGGIYVLVDDNEAVQHFGRFAGVLNAVPPADAIYFAYFAGSPEGEERRKARKIQAVQIGPKRIFGKREALSKALYGVGVYVVFRAYWLKNQK